MEQSGNLTHNHTEDSRLLPACGLDIKRQKELDNVALQTTLMSQMETESAAAAAGGQQSEQGEQLDGSAVEHRPAAPTHTEEEAVEPADNETKGRAEEERTLTDHLNKRLLSSFLEKLNERDLALPGVQSLDCAVADEDSNRAAEEW